MSLNTLVVPQLITEKQAAQMLAVSLAALRRWRREGRGPRFARLQRCVRYDVRSIEAFLAENCSNDKKAADSRSAAQLEVRDGHATLHA